MDTKAVIQTLTARRPKILLGRESALSSGSTLLNLACTDHPDFAFKKGGYYYLVGDSMSGKTWTSLTCFAEACLNPAFKNYRLVFDNVEGGAQMDMAFYFGKEVARRIELEESTTIESFYARLAKLSSAGKPFVYVLDSQDALTSKASAKKVSKQRKADEEGQEAAGSYGDGKAKYHSENIRQVLVELRRLGSILIIIGQTRDNLGFGFEKKTRSGGKALRFYADLEIWTSVFKKIKKVVRGKPRTIGSRCLAEVKKNRVTGKIGKDRSVEIPIYYGMGIDDVGSIIDYLVGEEHWRIDDKTIHAPELKFKGTRGQLIAYVEQEKLEPVLRKLAGELWATIEAECEPRRKKRYE